MIELFSQKDCRYVYREILQGYTQVSDHNFYIKHFSEYDLGFIDTVYKECFEECRGKGLPSREEKIKILEKEGFWDQQLDEHRVYLQSAIRDGHEFARGLGKKEGQPFLENEIYPKEKELKEIEEDFWELIEPVAETYCDKILNEKYVYHALYKDKECKNPLYTKEQFENLSFVEISELVKVYNYHCSKFTELNINKISVNPFFLNPFFMSADDPVKFFGKNVIDLTMYQLNIYARGQYNKTVLTEGKEPPEHFFSENEVNGLKKLVDWYNTAYAQIKAERTAQEAKAKGRGAAGRHIGL